MPDESKFTALREAGYQIKATCLFCVHGKFPHGSLWGECQRHQYEHGKHTGGSRNASVLGLGSCPQFEEDTVKVAVLGLGAHTEFLPGRTPKELPKSRGKKQRR